MSASIEAALGSLLNNSESSNAITALLKDIKKDTSNNEENESQNTDGQNLDKIQRKINIITALIPYLDEQSASKANIIIKILLISKLINELIQNN